MRFIYLLCKIPSSVLIFQVRCYQIFVSPILRAVCGNVCRFEPSCSQYFIEAVRKYGAVRGAVRGMKRFFRCHPWSRGGYDPP
ncbi:MAG: membrane protein insertion efficiency factor YidD [Planctomycetaceae bacterium]|nr:membrane protein insertion efficiency factor YidD [Planctomycetaceae bacterium]